MFSLLKTPEDINLAHACIYDLVILFYLCLCLNSCASMSNGKTAKYSV